MYILDGLVSDVISDHAECGKYFFPTADALAFLFQVSCDSVIRKPLFSRAAEGLGDAPSKHTRQYPFRYSSLQKQFCLYFSQSTPGKPFTCMQ